MRDLFTKPIELLTPDDVHSVLGWPESLLVEFKQQLSSRDGRVDAWTRDRNLDEQAKRGIFKELVALANTSGGHVVLGVSESDDKPPVASSICPVLQCEDLADRLERAAQAIDPPIPLLLVRGVPTETDGSGVVLFRVPASRTAPHRSIDKDCYIRRGEQSIPMTMREIQDMVIASGNRANAIEQRFKRSREECQALFDLPTREMKLKATGFRLTAIPSALPFNLPRLFNNIRGVGLRSDFPATVEIGGQRFRTVMYAPLNPTHVGPIMRGVSFTEAERSTFYNLHTDGTVEVVIGFDTRLGTAQLNLGWIVGYAANVMLTADELRKRAGLPDSEYAVELEILFHCPLLSLYGFGEVERLGDLANMQLILPRVSFGPISEMDLVLSQIVGDLTDAVGVRYSTTPRIELDPIIKLVS